MRVGRSYRLAVHTAVAVALGVGLASGAAAKSDGIILQSGKEQGHYCYPCHSGGTEPTVSFSGPGRMSPGESATFTFTVSSHSAAQIAAGFNVASSAGTLGVVAGQGARLQSNEVTHAEPKVNDAGANAAFSFTWRAPTTPGIYTLFGAGASVDLENGPSGDAASKTTAEVVVGEGVFTPTPAPTPTPTMALQICVGDCGGDGEVTVDELVLGVNIALGVTSKWACPEFDANDDGEVTVEELVQAVNYALSGCPRP